VDPFAIVILAVVVGFAIWLVVLGRMAPGSGLDALGLRGASEIVEQREALEAEDLEQLLAAHNRRRASRGLEAISASDYELRVLGEVNAQRRRDLEEIERGRRTGQHERQGQGPDAGERQSDRDHERRLAERELDELLEATNARRRARGLPERTREQAEREFGAGR
jgi:hypothetical protein